MTALMAAYREWLVKLKESLTKAGRFEEAVAVSEAVKALSLEGAKPRPAPSTGVKGRPRTIRDMR